MLRDEMIKREDPRWEIPDNMEAQYGTCKFCNQIHMVLPLFGPWDQVKLDEAAIEECDCSLAKAYTGRKERKEQAAKLIEVKFGKSSPEDDYKPENIEAVVGLLNTIADAVIDCKVGAVTVQVTYNTKCSIRLNADGTKIKIKRSITHTDEELA